MDDTLFPTKRLSLVEEGKIIMKKSLFIAGTLLVLITLGTAGCGSTSSNSQTSSNSANSSQMQGQAGPKQGQRNPALQAANEVRRLQNDTQMALSSDQKTKLKPILQDLINTTNTTSDYLQKQADTINALLTDQQKNYLTSSRPNGGNNSNGAKGNNSSNSNIAKPNTSEQNAQGGNNPTNGAPQNRGNGQNGQSIDAKTIYQQVLDLISK